jgi:hypothetical protein
LQTPGSLLAHQRAWTAQPAAAARGLRWRPAPGAAPAPPLFLPTQDPNHGRRALPRSAPSGGGATPDAVSRPPPTPRRWRPAPKSWISSALRPAPQAGAPLPYPPPSPESPRLHRGCTSPPPRPSAPHPRRGIRRGSRRRGVQRLQPFFGNPPSSTSSTQSTASMRLPRLSRLRQRIPAPGTV